jgi:hypothetical protein
MRPKQNATTGSSDLFRARLEQIINMKHELVQFAGKLDWTWIDGEIAPLYSDQGRSTFTACPTKACASAVLDTAPGRTIPVMSMPIAATAIRSSPQRCWPRVEPRRSCRPGLVGGQATIRCARSAAGIIACSASVAELRRSLEPGNAAMVCGACGGKGWRRQPFKSVSPRSLTI